MPGQIVIINYRLILEARFIEIQSFLESINFDPDDSAFLERGIRRDG